MHRPVETMGCGTITIKYILFIFNLICVVGGLVLITTGSLILLNLSKFGHHVIGEITTADHTSFAVFYVVVGCIMLLIAFFGCCGAIRESQCMITMYSVLMCIILLLQLICGILVFVYAPDIVALVKKEMETEMANYHKDGNEGLVAKNVWDKWQHDDQCCGIGGSQDWGSNIPSSCQETQKNNVTLHFSRGCYDLFVDKIHNLRIVTRVFSSFIVLIELIAIIFACYLGAAYRRANQYHMFSPTSDGQPLYSY